MNDIDLFGREVFDRIKGDQMPLFHQPVVIDRPIPDRVGSKNASDPRHTAAMFPNPKDSKHAAQ